MIESKPNNGVILPVNTPEFYVQMCKIGSHHWSVARLVELSKNLAIFDLPIAHINLYAQLGPFTLREMAGHVQSIVNADMEYPIILDEDGEIMDGRHRIMRAIAEGISSVKAVRFDVNPRPCKIEKDDD